MKFKANIYWATLYQLALPLLLLWLSRPLFYLYNAQIIGAIEPARLWEMMWHGLRFDLSALCYFNSLFILMRFLPVPSLTQRRWWWSASMVIYFITNGLMLMLQMADIPFYAFQGDRMRVSSLMELFTNPNLGGILLSSFANYWWAFIGFAALMAALAWGATRVKLSPLRCGWRLTVPMFVAAALLAFVLMRGITSVADLKGTVLGIGHARAYVERNSEACVVLNTPFTILRSSASKDVVPHYNWLPDSEIMSGIVTPPDTVVPNGKNLMLIILEGGSAHHSDFLTPVPDRQQHLMPFLDSLAAQSVVVKHHMATGQRSNEGFTSLIGSFPNYEPMILMRSPYAAERFDGLYNVTARRGYDTAFFYGCYPGSFNIEELARTLGAARVYNSDSYPGSERFIWGVHDHAMAQFVVEEITRTLHQPFTAVWFTLNAHEPYTVPDDWQSEGYRSPAGSMDRTVEYTDRALRRFFTLARREPWYANTIFIITADHGNRERRGTEWHTPWVQPHIPFVVYAPDGSLTPAVLTDRVMGQFDVMPTALGLIGENEPYVSFGANVLAPDFDAANHVALSRFFGYYQITAPDLVVQWDATDDRILAIFDPAADPWLQHPLADHTERAHALVGQAKALLQGHSRRLNSHRMSTN